MDSMIPNGQKNTLAEYMILSGADNHPPIEHGRMILESVEHGPLIWPMIEENEVTRTKKYAELSPTKKIQADCDLKANNIILQGLPTDIYSLVNHHRVAKDLWEKFQQQQQQQFSPSQSPQYGSNHLTQHYSTTYPSSPHSITYPSAPYPNAYSSTVHQEAYPQPRSIPQIEYTISTVNQQTHLAEFPQIDFGLAVPVLKQRDDPIDAINIMMSFLGDKFYYAAGTSETRANTSGTGKNYSGQQRDVKCFKCQGEGHIARQYPKTKRKRDATWFMEKVLLVEAQGNGKVLTKEELEFLADHGIAEGPVTHSVIIRNAAYQADDLDVCDSDCDEISTAKVVLMANLSSYRSDVLFEVPISENTNNDMLNQSVQEMLMCRCVGSRNSSIRRIEQCGDTTYWGFLRVRTTFDIFQNILLLYCEYGVLMSPGYGVLVFMSSWFLVKCRHGYAVSS
ncbi:retrovirus-related pol polyprotein from transposon TNT 1-94 [Tanacetum coccineum]